MNASTLDTLRPNRRQLFGLAAILLAAAALRFYGIGWGAPYFHFHIDEHFVLIGADRLRVSMKAAATSDKFFMYGPVPMHLLNALRWAFDHLREPLDLSTFDDQVTYTVLGRSINALLSVWTVLTVYFVGQRVGGTRAGLIASTLLATSVLHIAESHTFRVDVGMTFFVVVAWLFALRIVERGRWSDYIWLGVMTGLAVGCKYAGAFMLGVAGLAHLLAPGRPRWGDERRRWLVWVVKGSSPIIVMLVVFAIVNPMALLYPAKFVDDLRVQVFNPLTGVTAPIWSAQFTGVQPQVYWLRNLWWGLGPAMELWGLLGLAALVWRRTAAAAVVAAFPIGYFIAAGGTITPFSRYALPLAPALAVTGGAFSAWLHERAPLRLLGTVATTAVVTATAFYGIAYMNIYRMPDARLEASRFVLANIPADAHVLTEPSHGLPPLGAYLTKPDFHGDHVLWGAQRQRHDYYWLYTLDTYTYLYGGRPTAEQKRAYIESRVKLADYIVMDDFYLQLYQDLPEDKHGVVKQYYRDLFSGALGFDLMKTFKVYPSLFGVTINDDSAELSSRMNDHPRVYVFMRRQPRTER